MGAVRTVEPIEIDFFDITEEEKGEIIADIKANRAIGERGAVKMFVKLGRWSYIGWVSKEHFSAASVYEARKRPGYHRSS